MALTSIDRLKSWCKEESLAPEREAELSRCCDAATRLLCRVTGRNADRVTRSVTLDGDDATGRGNSILYLPRGDRPVIHTEDDALVVTEDGRTLSVAIGYSSSADVILHGVNEDSVAKLVRNSGPWSCGYQNIAVTYKCGWSLDVEGDSQPVPDEVIQLTSAIAWMIFTEPGWLGKLNVSDGGSSVSLNDKLPAWEQSVLQSLMVA